MTRNARVNFGGVIKSVSLACLPEAELGDYVIVHVGLAISKLDEDAALETLDYLRRINELEELERTTE